MSRKAIFSLLAVLALSLAAPTVSLAGQEGHRKARGHGHGHHHKKVVVPVRVVHRAPRVVPVQRAYRTYPDARRHDRVVYRVPVYTDRGYRYRSGTPCGQRTVEDRVWIRADGPRFRISVSF